LPYAHRWALIYVTGGAYKRKKDTFEGDKVVWEKDLVYAAWMDLTGAEGMCDSPSNEPNANVNSVCKTRIFFTRSTDGDSIHKEYYNITLDESVIEETPGSRSRQTTFKLM
jgi:hypothetical protein